jgi:hypothetical protein
MLVIFLISLVASMNPTTWIGDSLSIIGNLTLKNLTIPGTHDSGTYYSGDAPMPGADPLLWEILFKVAEETNQNVAVIAKYWEQSQDRNIYDQMVGGMRYFDVRCGWNSSTKTWVSFHFLQGSPIRELLQNITTFLVTYPKEIVIVEMSHFDGYPTNNDITQLKNMVLDILGPFLYFTDYTFNFTLNKMISSGRRALVAMDSGFDNVTIWSTSAIHNSYADTPNLSEMVAYNNKTVQAFMSGSHASQLFKISWTLTPNSTTIIDSVFPWKPQSLYQLAGVANKGLPSFWTSISKNNWRMGNILIIDLFDFSQIMNVTWAMNGLGYKSVDLH